MIQMLNVFAGTIQNVRGHSIDSHEFGFFRAHLNDLENILPYLFVGLFYVLINPAVGLATTLFKVAAFARIAHTLVYALIVIPQPARAIVWFIHYIITFYMALAILMYQK